MYRTLTEFEDIMQPIIASLLGWEGSLAKNVRIGWQQEGAPAFKISDDVVFISATLVHHYMNQQHDLFYEEGSPDLEETRSYTRVTSLNCIAYGINAMSNLSIIKLGMFYDTTRYELAQQQIYLMPDVVEPRRMPESFQGRWWERSDMQLQFYELLTDIRGQNAIDSVDISIDKESGVSLEFTISK